MARSDLVSGRLDSTARLGTEVCELPGTLLEPPRELRPRPRETLLEELCVLLGGSEDVL